MNRKGQIGNLLPVFLVLIIVFVIVAAFVIISLGMAATRTGGLASIASVVSDDLLLQDVGNRKALDVVVDFANSYSKLFGFNTNIVFDNLKGLVNRQNNYLFVGLDDGAYHTINACFVHDGTNINFVSGSSANNYCDIGSYVSAGYVRTTYFVVGSGSSAKTWGVNYYYGRSIK